MSDTGEEGDVIDVPERAKKISKKKFIFKRPFVFLPRRMSSVPQKGKLNDLTNAGRLKEIGFFKHHSAKEIGRLLLATFPALLGIDLKR